MIQTRRRNSGRPKKTGLPCACGGSVVVLPYMKTWCFKMKRRSSVWKPWIVSGMTFSCVGKTMLVPRPDDYSIPSPLCRSHMFLSKSRWLEKNEDSVWADRCWVSTPSCRLKTQVNMSQNASFTQSNYDFSFFPFFAVIVETSMCRNSSSFWVKSARRTPTRFSLLWVSFIIYYLSPCISSYHMRIDAYT